MECQASAILEYGWAVGLSMDMLDIKAMSDYIQAIVGQTFGRCSVPDVYLLIVRASLHE